MNPAELPISLNIAQLVMLGGVIWGLARMSRTVEMLAVTTTGQAADLKKIGDALGTLASRVMVLEDRADRRPSGLA